jgi:integrase
MALTKHQVSTIKERGRYGDGKGLYLQVMPTGARSWILRFERSGRERWMGLGPVSDFSLDEARERASQARRLLKDGFDPIDARQAERTQRATEEARAAARNITFKAAAEQCFKFHSPKWKNAKHRAQFLSTLKQYAYPSLGKLPVAAIDKTLVLKAVLPIWESKNETASRVRGRIEAVLDFAKVNGWRDGENPAAWDGNLVHALPAPGTFTQVKHHAALPFADVFDFMTQLATREGMGARALEFLILTAARTGEVIGARWSEINLETKLWTVPAIRMKAKKEHKVPLSDQAVAILKALPRDSGFVFPGGRKGVPISNMAMATLLKRMGRFDITVHGFRSTFRDWAAERTNYPNHVVEMALAHVIGDKVEAAYRRGDLLAKRAKLMADWSKYCATKPVGTANNVTPIRAGV